MNTTSVSFEKAFYISQFMRDWDRREIFATRWPFEDELHTFVDEVMASGPVSWVSGLEEPIACFGCRPLWPGVWSMWLFATDRFPEIGLPMTKMIVRHIVPMLFANGAHRLECKSMEGHVEAQRWLETLGARREGTLRAYGRQGEDFHTYVWDNPGQVSARSRAEARAA